MKHILLLLLLLLLSSCYVREKTATTSPPPADTLVTHHISLLFVGDLMQHLPQINAVRTDSGYDYSPCFQHVKEEIMKADLAIGNLETTLGDKPYRGYPMFSAPDDFAHHLKETGFDILLTANNHCLDRFSKGLKRTLQVLDSLQIPSAGTYTDEEDRNRRYPLLIERNGFKLSLLAYTYDTNGIEVQSPNIVNYIDTATIAHDIIRARAQHPDAIIACMHWGYEYQSLPSKEQRHLADWLIGKGVTHVIGSHPHVIQPMELRTDTVTGQQTAVVYSLGNFISNQQQPKTDGGAMFKLELTKDSVVSVSNCGYSLVWVAHPDRPRRKQHTLIPAGYPQDSLSAGEQRKMKVFVDGARKVLDANNKEVEEYTAL